MLLSDSVEEDGAKNKKTGKFFVQDISCGDIFFVAFLKTPFLLHFLLRVISEVLILYVMNLQL